MGAIPDCQIYPFLALYKGKELINVTYTFNLDRIANVVNGDHTEFDYLEQYPEAGEIKTKIVHWIIDMNSDDFALINILYVSGKSFTATLTNGNTQTINVDDIVYIVQHSDHLKVFMFDAEYEILDDLSKILDLINVTIP